MAEKILVVVDMQNDFVTGPLGTPEARAIVPHVVEKVRAAIEEGTWVCYTMDRHYGEYLNTHEGKLLPIPHCIAGTVGHEIIPELRELDEATICNKYSERIMQKHTFGYTGWDFTLPQPVSQIELIGVCTDVCVISNALMLRAHEKEAEIIVDATCCAGTTPDNHRAALQVMKSCQIKVIE